MLSSTAVIWFLSRFSSFKFGNLDRSSPGREVNWLLCRSLKHEKYKKMAKIRSKSPSNYADFGLTKLRWLRRVFQWTRAEARSRWRISDLHSWELWGLGMSIPSDSWIHQGHQVSLGCPADPPRGNWDLNWPEPPRHLPLAIGTWAAVAQVWSPIQFYPVDCLQSRLKRVFLITHNQGLCLFFWRCPGTSTLSTTRESVLLSLYF